MSDSPQFVHPKWITKAPAEWVEEVDEILPLAKRDRPTPAFFYETDRGLFCLLSNGAVIVKVSEAWHSIVGTGPMAVTRSNVGGMLADFGYSQVVEHETALPSDYTT
jgi:hypothetical protein